MLPSMLPELGLCDCSAAAFVAEQRFSARAAHGAEPPGPLWTLRAARPLWVSARKPYAAVFLLGERAAHFNDSCLGKFKRGKMEKFRKVAAVAAGVVSAFCSSLMPFATSFGQKLWLQCGQETKGNVWQKRAKMQWVGENERIRKNPRRLWGLFMRHFVHMLINEEMNAGSLKTEWGWITIHKKVESKIRSEVKHCRDFVHEIKERINYEQVEKCKIWSLAWQPFILPLLSDRNTRIKMTRPEQKECSPHS